MLSNFIKKFFDQATSTTLFLLLMLYDLINVLNDQLNLGWVLPYISESRDLAKPVALIYNNIYSLTFMFIVAILVIIITYIIWRLNPNSLAVGFPIYFVIFYYLFYLWLISFNICLFTGNLHLLNYSENWGAFMVPVALTLVSFGRSCYRQYEKAQ